MDFFFDSYFCLLAVVSATMYDETTARKDLFSSGMPDDRRVNSQFLFLNAINMTNQ
jgi:hypothetical protein